MWLSLSDIIVGCHRNRTKSNRNDKHFSNTATACIHFFQICSFAHIHTQTNRNHNCMAYEKDNFVSERDWKWKRECGCRKKTNFPVKWINDQLAFRFFLSHSHLFGKCNFCCFAFWKRNRDEALVRAAHKHALKKKQRSLSFAFLFSINSQRDTKRKTNLYVTIRSKYRWWWRRFATH